MALLEGFVSHHVDLYDVKRVVKSHHIRIVSPYKNKAYQ